jgi:hypothetical protein
MQPNTLTAETAENAEKLPIKIVEIATPSPQAPPVNVEIKETQV